MMVPPKEKAEEHVVRGEINVHHYMHYEHDHTSEHFQHRVLAMLATLTRQGKFEMAKIDDLAAAVARNSDAEDSVIVLLTGIAQQLRDAAGDPAKIDAVIASLDANNAKLAKAVVDNTPVVEAE